MPTTLTDEEAVKWNSFRVHLDHCDTTAKQYQQQIADAKVATDAKVAELEEKAKSLEWELSAMREYGQSVTSQLDEFKANEKDNNTATAIEMHRKTAVEAQAKHKELLLRLSAIPGQPEHAETAARMKAERIAALESELAAIKGPS